MLENASQKWKYHLFWGNKVLHFIIFQNQFTFADINSPAVSVPEVNLIIKYASVLAIADATHSFMSIILESPAVKNAKLYPVDRNVFHPDSAISLITRSNMHVCLETCRRKRDYEVNAEHRGEAMAE